MAKVRLKKIVPGKGVVITFVEESNNVKVKTHKKGKRLRKAKENDKSAE